jgi:hypothetical protein
MPISREEEVHPDEQDAEMENEGTGDEAETPEDAEVAPEDEENTGEATAEEGEEPGSRSSAESEVNVATTSETEPTDTPREAGTQGKRPRSTKRAGARKKSRRTVVSTEELRELRRMARELEEVKKAQDDRRPHRRAWGTSEDGEGSTGMATFRPTSREQAVPPFSPTLPLPRMVVRPGRVTDPGNPDRRPKSGAASSTTEVRTPDGRIHLESRGVEYGDEDMGSTTDDIEHRTRIRTARHTRPKSTREGMARHTSVDVGQPWHYEDDQDEGYSDEESVRSGAATSRPASRRPAGRNEDKYVSSGTGRLHRNSSMDDDEDTGGNADDARQERQAQRYHSHGNREDRQRSSSDRRSRRTQRDDEYTDERQQHREHVPRARSRKVKQPWDDLTTDEEATSRSDTSPDMPRKTDKGKASVPRRAPTTFTAPSYELGTGSKGLNGADDIDMDNLQSRLNDMSKSEVIRWVQRKVLRGGTKSAEENMALFATQVRNARLRYRGKMPAKFALGSESFTKFRERFRSYALTSGWDSTQQVAAMLRFLDGEAANTFNKWIEEGRFVEMDANLMWRLLQQHFCDPSEERQIDNQQSSTEG